MLLSGYHAASHKYWCEQLVGGLPEFNWVQLTLPDRHFYWRIRSNALSFAFQHPELESGLFDVILATSMVDVCNLRGLLPRLSKIPTVLYFHENQFAYPERQLADPAIQTGIRKSRSDSNLINAQLTSVYSALASDRLVFNSKYNRDTFFTGARALFEKMPDGTPGGLLDHLPAQSEVIPVPINDGVSYSGNNFHSSSNGPVEIVWNHRWEYDKQPQVFFAAMEKLIEGGYELSLHIMGQSFRKSPDCFGAFRKKHPQYITTWGHQPEETYRQLLQRADIVVSTALHDFQGLGMLEAIAAGCIPIAPDRMAYPEYIPAELLYSVSDGLVDGSGERSCAMEVQALCDKLESVVECNFAGVTASNDVSEIELDRYTLESVMPVYRRLFAGLVA